MGSPLLLCLVALLFISLEKVQSGVIKVHGRPPKISRPHILLPGDGIKELSGESSTSGESGDSSASGESGETSTSGESGESSTSGESGESGDGPPPESPFFPVGRDAIQPALFDGEYVTVLLQKPFLYAGQIYHQFYLSMDGYVAFYAPNIDDEVPDPQLGKDVIAPLWTDLDADSGGKWTYEQATEGPLLHIATEAINRMFPGFHYSASWVFVSTWENVPLEMSSFLGATFQLVLISDDKAHSFMLMNYGPIASISFPYWLAGYDVKNTDFVIIPVNESSQLSYSSNVHIPGRWAFPVPRRSTGPPVPDFFYPFWHGTEVDIFANDGNSPQITLQQAFHYFETYQSTIYVNKNGVLSFSKPLDEPSPDSSEEIDENIIAALWTNFKTVPTEKVIYQEVTGGPLLSRATQDINNMFPADNYYFSASWLFIATWEVMSFANSGNATFQAVLVSGTAGDSYIMLNYAQVSSADQYWRAGYEAEDGSSYFISVTDTFNLSSTTNVQIPGRWSFQVATSPCQSLNCVWDEVCTKKNGVYGCACSMYNGKPNPDTFDAYETCSGSSGSLSLSRCQLFEAGYSEDSLHLNDPSCKGQIQYDRLVFSYGNGYLCGTNLTNNGTNIIYKNSVGTSERKSVISHVGGLNIDFSCVYPLIQSISMPMEIHARGGYIYIFFPFLLTFKWVTLCFWHIPDSLFHYLFFPFYFSFMYLLSFNIL
ncbi:alpha-tectorin-like [Clarias gariepinus]|uniref:alpha-tectorin-like n=1 Tax=Clarias gariepinus TaxID=13013 RepID=UPI00234CC6B9|nr:alpha-tectorin-like [Clarias gariepinus]